MRISHASYGLEKRALEVNDIQLSYVIGGQDEGPVIILLHGFPQTWITWRYVIPKLTQTHKVIAIDLRGSGDSDIPGDMKSYDKKIMANDVKRLLDQHHIQKALIVGHDRGARVARRFGLDYPELATGLVFIDILPAEYVYSLSAEEAASKYWHWVFQVVPYLPEELITGKEEIYLKFLLSRGDGLFELLHTDGAWDSYLSSWMQPGAVAAALNDYKSTYHIDLPRYQLEAKRQKTLEPKTLVLWGEKGNLANMPVLDVWRQSINHVSGQEIKDCGHYVPEEKPGMVAQQIIDFSRSCF